MRALERSAPDRTLRRAVATVAAIVALVAGACTGSDPAGGPLVEAVDTAAAKPSLLGRLRERGTIRVGVKADLPLFGLRDPRTGTFSGFDVEIARGIATRLLPGADPATSIEFVEALSKDRERLLTEGSVDLIVSTYTINDARKAFVDFAGPYYIAGQDILAKRRDIDEGTITGVGDVNGKRVCSVTGSTSLANLREAAPEADTTVTKDKYSECFEALRRGDVDAMSTDDVILLGLAQNHPEFALTGNPFHTEPYGIGVPKGDDELRAFLNDALDAMFEDGTWAAAFRTTIGTTGANTPSPPTLDRYDR
jgi:glutamate transport system substrate-binding protein